jgi:hypothetical protein
MSYVASVSAYLLALAVMVGLFTLLERRLIAAVRTGRLLVNEVAKPFKKNA